MDGLQPIAAWDTRSSDWPSPAARRKARCAWLSSIGLDTLAVYRIEFFLIDAPFARVFAYRLDEHGYPYWESVHDPLDERHDHAACQPASTIDTLLLDGFPPGELL